MSYVVFVCRRTCGEEGVRMVAKSYMFQPLMSRCHVSRVHEAAGALRVLRLRTSGTRCGRACGRLFECGRRGYDAAGPQASSACDMIFYVAGPLRCSLAANVGDVVRPGPSGVPWLQLSVYDAFWTLRTSGKGLSIRVSTALCTVKA